MNTYYGNLVVGNVAPALQNDTPRATADAVGGALQARQAPTCRAGHPSTTAAGALLIPSEPPALGGGGGGSVAGGGLACVQRTTDWISCHLG